MNQQNPNQVESDGDRRYREHIADVTANGRMALISADGEILSVYGPGVEVPDPEQGQRIARVFWRGSSRGWQLVCTCEMEDDGDGESGPHLSVTCDPDCSIHGRAADPPAWDDAAPTSPWEDAAAAVLVATGRWQLAKSQPEHVTRLVPTGPMGFPLTAAAAAFNRAGWTARLTDGHLVLRWPGAGTGINECLFVDCRGAGVEISG